MYPGMYCILQLRAQLNDGLREYPINFGAETTRLLRFSLVEFPAEQRPNDCGPMGRTSPRGMLWLMAERTAAAVWFCSAGFHSDYAPPGIDL